MGREFPYGGINEKGLVIEIMWLTETNYPEMDERNGLTELQWIQYQLDNSATVEDVLASDSNLRISKLSLAPVHFLVCDSKGNMATIEYLKGKMIYRTKSTLPICALTNDTYDQSKVYLNSLTNPKAHSFTSDSFDRFAKAALMVRDFDGQNVINYSFDILASVSQGNITQWSIVYDIKNMTVHYKTQDNRKTRILKVNDFDFSCHSQSLYIDIGENMTDGKLRFHPYSYQKNRETMDKAFAKVEFIQSVPEEERELLARYPESTKCDK
jgi:choloylglycine hydrolase